MLTSVVPDYPANHALATLTPSTADMVAPLEAVTDSTTFDWAMRLRLGGLNVSWFVLEESPLPPARSPEVLWPATVLSAVTPVLAPLSPQGRRAALTPHECLRLRYILDALVAALYGLSRDDLRWILRDCDHPKALVNSRDFARTLDAKGFWRVDKEKDPELRHTMLTLIAFDALDALIQQNHGARDAGIAAFQALNDGEGWLLPETLRLADHHLGHDDRAKEPQPVASRLGPRFLDWQLAQAPEESWAECERHARAILGDEEFEARFDKGTKHATVRSSSTSTRSARDDRQGKLFD